MHHREEISKRPVSGGPSRLDDSFAYHLAKQTWLPTAVAHTRVELPATREAPSLARQATDGALGSLLDELETELIEVLVSELVSNAVAHAGLGPGDAVVLHVAAAPERIRVEVCDGGDGFSRAELGKPRSGPGGYGLTMVDRGASRWGISTEDGACVWFECDRGATRD